MTVTPDKAYMSRRVPHYSGKAPVESLSECDMQLRKGLQQALVDTSIASTASGPWR